jgi:hypothetical protein
MRRRYSLFCVLVFLFCTFFCGDLLAVDYTKDEGQVLDWTLLDDTGSDDPFAETTIQTISSQLEYVLNVVVCHNDTNDAGSNYVRIVVVVRAGSDNEAWRLHESIAVSGGQATSETLAANSGASQGNPERLEVADTTDFDTGGAEWLFLKDTGPLADSALVFIRGWSDNDYYINAWDLVRDYDNADILFNGVSQFKVRLPAGSQYFNVMFNNSDGDATYAVRVDYTAVTAIE